MAQRIFLHVGVPKSGTSYVQSVLWKNAAELRQEGLLLPGSFQLHYTAAKAITRRPGVRHRTRDRDQVAWSRLVRAIDDWPGIALVSHELLAPATLEQAAAAIGQLGQSELHLILTVRALHKQLPAAWQEQVKGGHAIRYDAFLEQVRTASGGRGEWFWTVQDVLGIIRRWGPDLPPEHVHIVTCPPRADDPALLWRRYASALGLGDGGYDLDVAPANRSLGVVEAELLRQVQAARDYRFQGKGRHLWTRRLLSSRLLAHRPGDPIRLPDDARFWIEQRTRTLVEGITAAGYDVVGDLDDLGWEPPRDTARLVTDVADTELANASAWTISRLQEELVQRQPQTSFPDVGPEDGVPGILELLEHIRAADTGEEPREPATPAPSRSTLRAIAHRLRR
jgi:hypothetical protein